MEENIRKGSIAENNGVKNTSNSERKNSTWKVMEWDIEMRKKENILN